MKKIYVAFANKKLEEKFESLEIGNFTEKQVSYNIEKAILNLKNNPVEGIKIPKKLWPKDYLTSFNITNLWKYDLPQAWRLIYTIKSNDSETIVIILEWFNHKNYERKFGY